MKKKKTFESMLRMDEDWGERITAVAENLSLSPAALNRIIMEKFVQAQEEHGSELIWPPQFNHHLNPQTYLDAIREADEERLQLVAEQTAGYIIEQKKKNGGK